jgi:hypothetical protein
MCGEVMGGQLKFEGLAAAIDGQNGAEIQWTGGHGVTPKCVIEIAK